MSKEKKIAKVIKNPIDKVYATYRNIRITMRRHAANSSTIHGFIGMRICLKKRK